VSNSLAIATTTVALADVVQSGLGAVSGATVTTLRPDDKEDAVPGPGANVFLFQIAASAAHRNADLPTRTGAGELRRRPQLGLELHYLITFYGDHATLEPQRLLGGAVTALHARPRLTANAIQAIVDASAGADPSDPRHFLGATDLAEQVEHVGFTPMTLTLEELSKLWSTLFRVPYALSVLYRASVVLVEAEVTPKPALPVRASNLYVLPIRRPLVERVEAADGPDAPLLPGATLVVRGQRLRGDEVRVRVGDAVAEPEAEAIGDTEVAVALDAPPFAAGALRAGVQGVQVLQPLELGTPPAPHDGFESNVAPVVLHPVLTGATVSDVEGTGSQPRDAVVTVAVAPVVGAAQRVVLLLDATEGDEAFSFRADQRAADDDPVRVAVTGVRAGTYLIRIQVDGAESLLEIDGGRYAQPTVAVP